MFSEINTLNENFLVMLMMAASGFVLAMSLTPIYTFYAYKYKAWKHARVKDVTGGNAAIYNRMHKKKHQNNIPTMAGIIMIVAGTAVTLLWQNYDREQALLPLLGFLGGGSVGLIDDYLNIRGSNKDDAGLDFRSKISMTTLVALAGGLFFHFRVGYDSLHVPFLDQQVLIGPLLVLVFAFVVIATANAVNITDGLDGLSGGLLAEAFFAYTLIAFLQGNFGIASFCATMVGVLLAYTWFNIYPARFFMGDSGSFAMGTALGVVAMLTDTMLLLPVIGGIFVMEASSSIIQIFSKRFFGRKVFKVAPIHHHFEASGWPETKVTMRFWILGAGCGGLGIILAVAGGSI